MKTIKDEINFFPLFQGLTNVQKARLYPYLSEKKHATQSNIIQQGDTADKIILILKGSPQLAFNKEDGQKIVVRNIGTSCYYGLCEVINNEQYNFSLYARHYTEYYELNVSGVKKIIDYNPQTLKIELNKQYQMMGSLCHLFRQKDNTYQLATIWKSLNQQEQLFIRLTFLMEKINEQECEIVLKKKGTGSIIQSIAKHPQILSPMNEEGTDFCYATELKLFLINNRMVSEKQIEKQHMRIAKKAIRQQEWEIAISHCIKSEQFDTAVLCLKKYFDSPQFNKEHYQSYLESLPSESINLLPKMQKEEDKSRIRRDSLAEYFRSLTYDYKENLGWMLCLILPSIAYLLADIYEFSWDQKIFMCILTSSVVMWMFKLVGDYIVSIYILIACLTLKIVPAKIVLSGFTSGSFFLAMSVFGLGAVLLNSGLIYRISLMILYYFPPTLFWQNLALALVGTIITPVIPSANGRLSLVSPTVLDMTEIMGYRPLSKAGVRLSMSTLSGFGLMSNFFLTGKSINFVILGLLPVSLQTRFTFGFWMMAAGIAFIITFIGRFILAAMMFKAETPPKISKDQIKEQINILGKLNIPEWIALIACCIFLGGVMTASLHKIKTAWVGVLLLFCVLFIGELGKDDFKRKIDWPFLLFLGGLIGFVNAFKYLDLDTWMSTQLYFLPFFMSQNFFLFILILSAIIIFIRLILPANATVALLCAILMPVAQANGINPWIIGFCILVISGGWLFPYQSTFYLTFYHSTDGKLFNDEQTLYYNMLGNIVNILALLFSIPYWHMLGLLK